jgi:hypothetical protein
LHGLPYLNKEMSIPWKIIWILFMLAICSISIYIIIINARQHLKASTVTTIDSAMASLDDVTFPSFYICNTNQVFCCTQKQYSLWDSKLGIIQKKCM